MSTAIAFDFAQRKIETVPLSDVAAQVAADAYCWVDIDALGDVEHALVALGIDPATIERVVENQAEGQFQHG